MLLALFQALLDNTHSPDVRHLAVAQAVATLKGLISKEEVEEIAAKLMSIRHKSPMDCLF